MMTTMNRRRFAIALASVASLTGCDTEQKPAATATLLNNGEVQQAMKSLASAVENLMADVGDFDTMNWREVVPNVSHASEEVDAAFAALRRALDVPNA